uniref:CW domain-containing protein n=1 Tax=Caenorhabditis tropicalis TaxID=1561998 RepID=A0A1I7UGU7_9PELO
MNALKSVRRTLNVSSPARNPIQNRVIYSLGIRVYTEQPACELNLALLLNGKKYPLYENNTEEYLWTIDTSEDGWTIQYIRSLKNNGMICGNWTYLRPYPDGCDPECLLTMVQIYAETGPLSPCPKNETSQISGWNECMTLCYENSFCLIAFLTEEGYCSWYSIDDGVYFLKKTTADSGKRMVVKLNLNNETCTLTTDKLLEDNFFMADGTEKTLQMNFTQASGKPDLPFYRVKTTDEYYIMMYYGNEEAKNAKNGFGCPIYFDTDYLGLTVTPSQQMCTRPFQLPGVTQPDAKMFCEGLGGHLFVERFSTFLNSGETQRLVAEEFGKEWGFGRLGGENWKIWMGLEADPECGEEEDQTTGYCSGNQKWRYSEPSWPMLYNGASSISFSWESGHPIPQKKSAYLQVKGSGDTVSGHSLFSADCTQSDLDGFVCATYLQQEMGIPKYADMMAKYNFS